jgi:hypothetical protein
LQGYEKITHKNNLETAGTQPYLDHIRVENSKSKAAKKSKGKRFVSK